MQLVNRAFSLALPKAGRSNPAKIAMMAITTSNSINVNPCCLRFIFIGNSGVQGEKVCLINVVVNQQSGCLTKQKGDPLGIALKNEVIK